MADILTTLPTQTELLTLSTLRPSKPPSLPHAPSILQRLIELTSTKWISDFLFTTEPIHVPHFTSPSLSTNALLAHVTTTRTSPEETLHNAAKFLFLPAFIADSTTYGFGLMSGAELRGSDLTTKIPMTIPLRFLRNATTGEFVMVLDTPALDCMMIYYSVGVTVTTMKAFTARFSRSRFLKALADNNGFVKANALLPALIHILEEVYVRPCAFCGMPAGLEQCGCIRNVSAPKHPFDFQHFKNGFAQDFGAFEGVANKVLADGTQAVQGVRVRRNVVQDVGSVLQLGGWVIRQHLKGSQNPWDSVMFSKHANEEADNVGELAAGDVVKELMAIEGGPQGVEMGAAGMGSPVSAGASTGTSSRADMMDGFELAGRQFGMTEEIADFGLQWWECEDDGHNVVKRGNDVTQDLELAMKRKLADERRKQRNRESAKRSNAKNKLKREEAQRELNDLYEKEEQLRAHETALRKENLRLKELVKRF